MTFRKPPHLHIANKASNEYKWGKSMEHVCVQEGMLEPHPCPFFARPT